MNCPTCGHPTSAHSDTGGWCLFPDCQCGRRISIEFEFHVIRDGISWIVHVHSEQTQPKDFSFSVTGETEDEAIWNAARALRTGRIR